MRLLAYPFSILYGLITSLRNLLFDKGILKSIPTRNFSIGVGNLQVGGAGKTPFVKYLLEKRILENPAMISRGYGRKTKGLIHLNTSSKPSEVGDEPLQIFNYFKGEIPVVVSEVRLKAANSLPKNEYIFDDVFQHRSIKPTLNLLLTPYELPFFKDLILPAGRLRESRIAAKRADAIIVTKCPPNMNIGVFSKGISKYLLGKTPLFFAEYLNSVPVNIKDEVLSNNDEVVLLAGLASHKYFLAYAQENYSVKYTKFYKDHKNYTRDQLKSVLNEEKILTTAKDYIKLKDICTTQELTKIYYTDTTVRVIDEENFLSFLRTFKKNAK